jgi:periplasmic divalent cation tolerance protein
MERPVLVYTTFPDEDTALEIADALVREKLAACVNLIPRMKSVYAWRGAVERAEEVVGIIKTRDGLREQVRAALKERHPYETPIILFLEVRAVIPARSPGSLRRPGGMMHARQKRTGACAPVEEVRV